MWVGVNGDGTNWVGASGVTINVEMELSIASLGACLEAMQLLEAVFDC